MIHALVKYCGFVLMAAVLLTPRAHAYVAMLDEVDAPPGNLGYYLILPAWENSLPGTKKNAYFIVPKYLAISGNINPDGPALQFGVQHVGFTLLPNGSADWPPSVRVIATVEMYRNDTEIKKLQDALTKRDVAAGLQPPDFPSIVFEKFKATANIGGVGSRNEGMQTVVSSNLGGAAGQPLIFDFRVPGDLATSYIFDLPPSAGRNSALWGVSMMGTIPGYADRLKCKIHMDHKKVYQHFKARASGQAYWGLVKADIATEMQSMDQSQNIDFGSCRGSAAQIEKMAIPIWTKILEMSDQEGNKMFQAMIQKSAGIPGHPEAGSAGWGFQFSAGFESVDYKDSTDINFDISFKSSLEIPFAMTFATVCSSWKQYFINGTDPKKPCISANDYGDVRPASKLCYAENVRFINSTYGSDPDLKKRALARLQVMGCAYDGGFDKAFIQQVFLAARGESTDKSQTIAVKACRAASIGLLNKWQRSGVIGSADKRELAKDSDAQACNWRPDSSAKVASKIPGAFEAWTAAAKTLAVQFAERK